MKPDSAGLWVSEDGQVAVVHYVEDYRGTYFAHLYTERFQEITKNNNLDYYMISELPNCRWQKVEVPKPDFPPEKPNVVYAKSHHCGPCWWMVGGQIAVTYSTHSVSGYTAGVKALKLVNHPEQPEDTAEILKRAQDEG